MDIRTGAAVTGVDHGPSGVEVQTHRHGTLRADAALLTLPLPLQRDLDIRPRMPKAWRRAASRLELGLLNKVVLRFESPFWDEQSAVLGIASTPTPLVAEWWNLLPITGAPILMRLVGGSGAGFIEDHGDTAVLAAVMDDIGRHVVAAPAAPATFEVTRWQSDPWSRGS